MKINFNTTYIFMNARYEIILMKVERESRPPVRGFFTQNYIMDEFSQKWEKITMESFNNMNLKYIGQFKGTVEEINRRGEIEIAEYPYPMGEIVQGIHSIQVWNIYEAEAIIKSMKGFIQAKKNLPTKKPKKVKKVSKTDHWDSDEGEVSDIESFHQF